MRVCSYVRLHIYMYAYILARTHACMHGWMHGCMDAWMHVCMYACMHVCMYACTHARMHVCTYARMRVCEYACQFIYLFVSSSVLCVQVIRQRTRIQFENFRICIRNYNYFPPCIGITNICFCDNWTISGYSISTTGYLSPS